MICDGHPVRSDDMLVDYLQFLNQRDFLARTCDDWMTYLREIINDALRIIRARSDEEVEYIFDEINQQYEDDPDEDDDYEDDGDIAELPEVFKRPEPIKYDDSAREGLKTARFICHIPSERHYNDEEDGELYGKDIATLIKLLPVPALTMSNWELSGFTRLWIIVRDKGLQDAGSLYVLASYLAGFWRVTTVDVHFGWGNEQDTKNFEERMELRRRHAIKKKEAE